eukprot:14202379-Ditylum_brightwellii.AAC.1
MHEPLITLHTTKTETISLQEFCARDSNNKDGDKNGDGGGGTELMLHEKKTATTGWRTLLLHPALYETVQVWNTPS